MGQRVNQKTLTAILGCSERHVINMRKHEGLPVVEHSPGHPTIYDTADVVQFLTDRAVDRALRDSIETDSGITRPRQIQLDLTSEQARIAKARADKLEMENAVKRGELIPVDEVRLLIQSAAIVVRDKLQSMAVRLATHVVGVKTVRQAKTLIDERVNDCLGELSHASDELLQLTDSAVEAERRAMGDDVPPT